jgi:DNA-binding transcriptional ArsR family regulator
MFIYHKDKIMHTKSCIRLYADREKIDACKQKLSAKSSSLHTLSNVLSLSGNEVRLKIIYLLHEEPELCPCDMADILGMSVPAVSQHLRKMKDGNLVVYRREGQTLFYSLKSQHKDILNVLFSYLTNPKEDELV